MDDNEVKISMDDIYDLIRAQAKLNMLRELLFNNAGLNYNGKLLTVKSDEAFTQMLMAFFPADAEDKYEELISKLEV